MKKHPDIERIVEISSGSPVTDVEKIHLDTCPVCKNRMESVSYIEKGLKDAVKVEPIMDLDHIESLADEVFDKCYEKDRAGLRKWIAYAGAGAVAASILLAVYLFSNFNAKDAVETAVNEPAGVQQIAEEESVQSVENETPKGVFNIAQGSLIAKENYELTAVTDSLIVHEYENYFSVMEGTVEFKVRTGTEFMVNLNNSALIRVLGTVFKVTVDKKGSSVEVSEGLVEVIDLRKGTSSTVAKGESGHIRNIAKTERQIVDAVPENIVHKAVITDENVHNVPAVKKKDQIQPFNVNKDIDLIKAEISDLETALQYSGAPVVQLHRLFELYRKMGHWGSIIHFWRTESSEIDSRGNPFLKDMHFAACEASIKMFLYDNEVCRKYRAAYPEGPDPDGMEDHLKMAW